MEAALKEECIDIIGAYTVEEGKAAFREYGGDFDLIVMDGELRVTKSVTEDTCELIRWICAQGFRGKMIAWASIPSHRREQLAAGCDIELEKYRLPEFIKNSLVVSAS